MLAVFVGISLTRIHIAQQRCERTLLPSCHSLADVEASMVETPALRGGLELDPRLVCFLRQDVVEVNQSLSSWSCEVRDLAQWHNACENLWLEGGVETTVYMCVYVWCV